MISIVQALESRVLVLILAQKVLVALLHRAHGKRGEALSLVVVAAKTQALAASAPALVSLLLDTSPASPALQRSLPRKR